jgi:hypothetical protein
MEDTAMSSKTAFDTITKTKEERLTKLSSGASQKTMAPAKACSFHPRLP